MARKRTAKKAEEGAAWTAPSGPFRLGIVVKCWQRPAITSFVLGYLSALKVKGVKVVGAAVVSPGDPQPHERAKGWVYVEAPNRPLSPKGNAAVQALRGKVDAVLNVGSDDIVSAAYVAEAVKLIREGADVVLPTNLCLFDVQTGRALSVDAPRIGAGRVVSAALLDRLDWNLWPDKGELPDADMDAQISRRAKGAVKATLPGADLESGLVVLDIKGHDNIGSFDQVRENRTKTGQARSIDAAAMWSALGIDPASVDALQSGYRRDREPVRMTALVNIPKSMLAPKGERHGPASAGRVERFDDFDCPPEMVPTLVRSGYAKRK